MGGASAPPFFRHFPFKIGDLGAHPGKICLPLILICLPLILIRGRQRKIMRRVGKIGRRKVFSEVKNVNVESPKKRSKLLDFWSGAGVKSRATSYCYFLFYVSYVRYVRNVRNKRYVRFAPSAFKFPFVPSAFKTKCKRSFDSEKLPLGQFFGVKTKNASEKGGSLSNMKIISCVRFELDFRGQIFTRRRSIDVAM